MHNFVVLWNFSGRSSLDLRTILICYHSALIFLLGAALSGTCQSDQFKCANKKCVDGGDVCDDIDDCGDLTDEIGCRKWTRIYFSKSVQRSLTGNYIQYQMHNIAQKKLHIVLDKASGASCTRDNGGCEHNCTDLRGGGYVCHCNDGFAISDIDKKSCKGMLNVD